MPSITLPLAFALVSFAPAQQFVQAVGALPGPAVWSEGVCAADVDRDGDLFRCELPAFPAGPTGRVAYTLRATDWPGNVGWSDSGVLNEPGVVGAAHCAPLANSSGAPARIVARGNDVLAAQALTLEVFALPTSSSGYFVAARTRAATPVSQGILCLGQPLSRFSNFVQFSGATGAVSLALPFQALPPSASFLVGEAWSFQYWFRDANPTVGANFSDAVEVVWQ